ncbi:hypothetical protein BKI52_19220 [marine bacterium AO1-C]|nr:hypothetical protein BKI52_19220 [marine bacterium AO1-C]
MREEYEELVSVLSSYTEKLKNHLLSLEQEKSKLQSKVLIFFVSIISLIFISLSLSNNIRPLAQNDVIYKSQAYYILFYLGIIVLLSLFIGMLIVIRNYYMKRSTEKLELTIKRKQLIKLIKYISQYEEHGNFSLIQHFLMNLRLTEAEEIITLSKKHNGYSKLRRPDEKTEKDIENIWAN